MGNQDRAKSLLVLTDLKKSYDSPVVNGSMAMQRGERVALIGPSGIGKSTLLHLISGILRPDGGSVVLNGCNLNDLGEAELDQFRARNIGYIFQSFYLLDGLTALENVEAAVTFAGTGQYNRARELLCQLGLEDRLNYFPPQLSVGQRQRVAVARAVVNQPPLVLADEPTANLDRKRAAEVIALIKESCDQSNAALLVVSHSPETLTEFHRVLDFQAHFQESA